MRLDGQKLRTLMEERSLTQAELGTRASLARPTIGRLLQNASTQIHANTERKLSQALGLPIGSLDADNLSTQYLSAVARAHEALDLTGLGLIQDREPISMDLAYAPLSVRRRHTAGICEPRAHDRSIQMRAEQTAMPLSRALELSKSIFLLGPPGSGKTTSLRHIARAYAQGRQGELSYPKSQLVPVVVRLASLAEHLQIDKRADLFAVAISELELHDSEATVAWLHACASSGNVLFLLDGLDEVPDPDQQAVVLEYLRPIMRKYKEARVVITSREVGFDFPNLRTDFDVYVVEPLTRNVNEKFIGTWQASRHHHPPSRKCKSCEQDVNRLQHAILENSQISALAGNPMILTILCLLHEAGAALPQRRCELYEKISETFLFCWEEKKRKAGAAASDRALTLENREVLWALESLALHMQENDITLFPRFLLLQHFNTFLRDELGLKAEDARLAADTLTWSLQARSGLLRELGPERYGFSHRAFQEYFAARAILSHADPLDRLRPYLYHPGWHEVVRLVAAQLDRRRAPQLIRLLLDDPDPTGRFLNRGLLLALECLADGAPIHEKELLDELHIRTIDLGKTKWLGLPLSAIGSLLELETTRLRAFASETLDQLLEVARQHSEPEQADLLEFAVNSTASANPPSDAAIGSRTIGALVQCLHEDESADERGSAAALLGAHAASGTKVREELIRALTKEMEPDVRGSIAWALRSVAHRRDVKEALFAGFKSDHDQSVRETCAVALATAARHDRVIQGEFVSVLSSRNNGSCKAGAARGLQLCVEDDEELQQLLWSRLEDAKEEELVRIACLWALEEVLASRSHGLNGVAALITQPENTLLVRVAAQILARIARAGKAEWTRLPIEKIEQVLISIEDPCPHEFDALCSLIDGRERRKFVLAREKRIENALSEFDARLEVVFIFGSAAKLEQDRESDLDLMVIGDVSLRDLTPALKRLELELGRQMNAVIYSKEEWSSRLKERNPFALNVWNGEKIFVKGGQHELAAVAR